MGFKMKKKTAEVEEVKEEKKGKKGLSLVKGKGTTEKETKKTTGKKTEAKVIPRGRKKGVSYAVSEKYQKKITEAFDSFEELVDTVKEELKKFNTKANRSAAKNARLALSEIKKACKPLRDIIQEAKENIKEV